MSRCFPYPPPGYAGKPASNDALILTIKLQRESEKVKSEKKKDRKREKKEKKEKEKKREGKANGTLYGEKKILATGDEKLYQAGKHAKCPVDFSQNRQQEASYELMEKSSLTEEHGRPSHSSDSTENSGNKRKRQSPPQAVNNAPNPGTVFRIVLNSPKEGAPTTSLNKGAPTTSLSKGAPTTSLSKGAPTTSSRNVSLRLTTGRVKSLSEKADAVVKSSTSILPIPPVMSNATQQLIITPSNKEKLPFPVKLIDEGSTSKAEKKLPRPLRKYKALFENWDLPSMEVDTVNDDEDWLFSSNSEKRAKCCKEEIPNCVVEPSFQPRARFLGDADIYALPFTVPF